MSEARFGTPGDGERSSAGQVRTYRGRTIEELIPQIREELGPDAIILREREGLTGGIGGFFAQRCVEIDAQAAPRLSVYDDDFDDEDEEYGEYEEAVAEEQPTAEQPPAPAAPPQPITWPEPVAWPEPATAAQPETPLEPAAPPKPAAPPPPAALPRRSAALFLDEASFAARLEEATSAAEQEPPPAPVSQPAPIRPATPAFIPFDELEEEDATDEEEAAVPESPALDETPPPTLSHRLLDLAEVNFAEPAEPVEAEPAAPSEVEAEAEPFSPVEAEPAPAIRSEPSPPAFVEPEPEPAPEPEPIDLTPDPTAPWMTFAAEQVQAARAEPAVPTRAHPAPAASGAPPPLAPTPARQPAPRAAPTPPASTTPASQAGSPVPAPTTPQGPPQAASTPAPQPAPHTAPAGGHQPWPPSPYGPRRRGGILPVAERMLRAALEATAAANERRNLELEARYTAPPQLPASPYSPPATPVPPPPGPTPTPETAGPQPDPEADARARRREEEHRREAQLGERLVQSGVSGQRASTLVAAAVSRRGPFSSDSELADEVRSAIASALPPPRPVPRRGAIAVVGAGGSGKTRSVAALATAYAEAGIPVSVASFGSPAREDELGELLHGEDVNIIPAMRTRATARAVASAREESLVIIDTASATPGDGSAIDVIAEAVRSFELDAVYLAVPATLSLPAGLKLVDGFSPFDLAGIIATHVDETDQLGVIAELAMRTSIPIAYTHTGLDLQNAIASADAGDIATSLL